MNTYPNKIWTLTCVYADEKHMIRHPKTGEIKIPTTTHTCGYYFAYDEARRAIAEDQFSMQECMYNYLVLERMSEGIPAMSSIELWFKWSRRKWKPTNKPKWAKAINWAMG